VRKTVFTSDTLGISHLK